MPAFPTQSLGSVGRCIYCGATTPPLSDEHVIPYSLGGNLLLKNASCGTCSKVTASVEQVIAREMLILPRTMYELPTRRPKERPKTYPLKVNVEGNVQVVELPIKDHLPILPLPLFDPPIVLELRRYDGGIALRGIDLCRFLNGAEEQLDNRFGHGNWSLDLKVPGVEWARMIAKVAYGFAVGRHGVDSFANVYVLPCILGEKNDVGRWVGCLKGGQDNTTYDGLHGLSIGFYGHKVAVHVRLFGQLGGPEYIAVVGDVTEATKAALLTRNQASSMALLSTPELS